MSRPGLVVGWLCAAGPLGLFGVAVVLAWPVELAGLSPRQPKWESLALAGRPQGCWAGLGGPGHSPKLGTSLVGWQLGLGSGLRLGRELLLGLGTPAGSWLAKPHAQELAGGEERTMQSRSRWWLGMALEGPNATRLQVEMGEGVVAFGALARRHRLRNAQAPKQLRQHIFQALLDLLGHRGLDH